MDLNKTKKVLDILSKNLTKKDFKKVMDFMYSISMGVEFNVTQQFYNALLSQYYKTDDKKHNVVKLKVMKGGKNA
jgi:hypothetical protein|tara:strand:- start:603 stop:827 length:225 start_codon:yes stop_codon:yes gene_type:complete